MFVQRVSSLKFHVFIICSWKLLNAIPEIDWRISWKEVLGAFHEQSRAFEPNQVLEIQPRHISRYNMLAETRSWDTIFCIKCGLDTPDLEWKKCPCLSINCQMSKRSVMFLRNCNNLNSCVGVTQFMDAHLIKIPKPWSGLRNWNVETSSWISVRKLHTKRCF